MHITGLSTYGGGLVFGNEARFFNPAFPPMGEGGAKRRMRGIVEAR